MARPRRKVPTYRKHRKTGRGCVSVYKADGSRTEILLPGEYGSDESTKEYERILAQLRGSGGKLPPDQKTMSDLTVVELVERFMREKVDGCYLRKDGTETGEKANFVKSFKPLVRLFGSKPAREFTTLDLHAYRDALISGSWMNDDEKVQRRKTRGGDGTCGRRTTNQRIGRVKRLFGWAVEKMLLSESVWGALKAVKGLEAGRSKARENEPVEAVPLEIVEATLPHCTEIIADMIRTQLYTGARAGEIIKMRPKDIDKKTVEGVWVFTPRTHKTQWRGHRRHITIGPRCQLVLRKYLRDDDPEGYVFRPGTIRPGGSIKHRPHFDVPHYDKGIAAACKRAGVQHWSSHQLRKLASRLAEGEVSLEGARAYLGQKSVDMAAHYAGIDMNKAAEVARRIG